MFIASHGLWTPLAATYRNSTCCKKDWSPLILMQQASCYITPHMCMNSRWRGNTHKVIGLIGPYCTQTRKTDVRFLASRVYLLAGACGRAIASG